MKIFEFQFNSRERNDTYFKTFSQEGLYFAGELANALPQNSRFLSNLAETAKEQYFSSREHNFKETLQHVGEFLGKEMQKGNVDWLGNLHAAILAFSRNGTNSRQLFSFAKSGAIRVLLCRQSRISDFGEHIRDFKNFVAGQVLPQDKILVCTPELFDALRKCNVLEDLTNFEEEKQFKELFKHKEKELVKISGVLLCFLVEEIPQTKARVRPFKIPFEIPQLPSFSQNQKRNVLLVFLLVLILGFGFLAFQ